MERRSERFIHAGNVNSAIPNQARLAADRDAEMLNNNSYNIFLHHFSFLLWFIEARQRFLMKHCSGRKHFEISDM